MLIHVFDRRFGCGLSFALDPVVVDEGERLQGFAQAHIVGEDPAEVMFTEKCQPSEALHLVGPQLRVHGLGHGHLGDGIEVPQPVHEFGPSGIVGNIVGEVLEFVVQGRLG